MASGEIDLVVAVKAIINDILQDPANVKGIAVSGADGVKPFAMSDTVWDDIPTSIMNVKLPNSGAPLEVVWNHGVVGGVTFPSLGFDVGEYVYIIVQTPHSMKLNTILNQHIHFSTPTDGTGDKFKFQLDVIVAGVNGAWSVPTGSPFTAETTMAEDLTGKHSILDLADIPASNNTVSTLYKMKLTRIAASADEYSGRVYVEFNDGHFEMDDLGSKDEYIK